ncbi:MAG: hypothetical protein JO040_12655 [Gemmatimonadetes bacterium]|nr:hypothetical protein [Gemmatimonadota bacterium]
MPEGSLTAEIQNLQGAFAAVGGLLGTPAAGDGSGGAGFSGAASLSASSPGDRTASFSADFSLQFQGTLRFDAGAALGGITQTFAGLRTEAQGLPTQALTAYGTRITQAGAAFSGDFGQQIQQALDAIRGISEGIPTDRSAIASALLDQVLRILGTLEGPEAERIRAWIQSVQELHALLMPLIDQAQHSDDPAAIVVEVFRRSLASTLEVFGFGVVARFVDFLTGFLAPPLPADHTAGIAPGFAAVASAQAQVAAAVHADFPTFRAQVVAAADTFAALRADLRPVLSATRRVADAKFLQPGALEAFLRERIDRALGVQVHEVQKIDDPFKALFDRIDEAIGQVDLGVVRTEVLGFFERTRDTIREVDVGSVGDRLNEGFQSVEGVIGGLEQGVADLMAQIRAFFDELRERLRALAGEVGTFAADGSFHYHVEEDLKRVLTTARTAIGGDPADPAAPSVAGALTGFRTNLDAFLGRLDELLDPVEDAVDDAVAAAVDGIAAFKTYLDGLDIPGLMEQLRQKVQEVLDALLPIDFTVVVDPVVGEIQANTEKIRSIDTSKLNDLLKGALSAALGVVIQIDFTAAISDPLNEQFAQIRAVPAQAIEQLQARYEQAVSMLDQLSPSALLEALFAAFDVVKDAVAGVTLASLTAPLDELHAQYLQEPLEDLKPSVLLQPVSDAFHGFVTVFDGIHGAQLIAPVNDPLNQLKAQIAAFDVTSWVDDLVAAVEKVQHDLRDIRPSEFLQPLVDEFARLEGELDRFKPSVVFQPVVELAAPLLQFLEGVQQQTIDAIHQAFAIPLQVLDFLQPEELVARLREFIDSVLAGLEALQVPTRFNALKGAHFDLRASVQAGGEEHRLVLAGYLDPEEQLGEIVRAHNDLVAALRAIRGRLDLSGLVEVYGELRDRLLGMLPPYARALLDEENFKRVMRLADPTRFLQELDQRFDALKNRLIPIRPQDIAAELDAVYDEVLALVDQLDVTESLNRLKELIERVKGIAQGIRIDFVAADIDAAVGDVKAVVGGLDPANLFVELDAIHHEVELVVASTRPSVMLAALGEPLDRVKGLVERLDPRTTLGPPLDAAWESVQTALDGVDFTVVLAPVVDKLDELEAEFVAGLKRTESAFDAMLAAGQSKLAGAGGASLSVSAGVSF